jgi:hypothetical protein
MSAKKLHESALSDVMAAHRTRVSEHSSPQMADKLDTQVLKPLAKSKDPNYVKLVAYVPVSTHSRLKAKAAIARREISDVLFELVEKHLKED